MKKESNLTRRILTYLNSLPGCKAIKIHGSVHQQRGTPDILCVLRGQAIFFEVKVGSGRTTEIQQHRIRQWRSVGAKVEVVRSVEEVKTLLGFDVERPQPFVIGP